MLPPPPIVHGVLDLGGAGRVIGVFRDAARAERIVERDPAYYKITTLPRERLYNT